jgi:hypothetical protein
MHKKEPKQESNQAILARVKKEMDEPHMAESTREEYDVNHTTQQELAERAARQRVFADGLFGHGKTILPFLFLCSSWHTRRKLR